MLKQLGRLAVLLLYTLVFWVALPAAIWAAASAVDARIPWRPQAAWAGIALLWAGGSLLAWGIAELWRGGGGLPVSALPPPRLAHRGPYAIVRHPIYLGFSTLLLGWGLAVGSPGMTFVVAPAFAGVWVAYALWEERGLARRFGSAWTRYVRRVGLWPRFPLYRFGQLAMRLQAFPSRVEGDGRVPAHGPAVLIANHACYVDFLYVGHVTGRRVHFLTTAEAFRAGPMAWAVQRGGGVQVRRYRPDPSACRELVRLLAQGELVGLFPEGERSVLGAYQGAMPDVAAILARLPVPVIPVGLSGNEDVGPRWSQAMRRRRVTVRVGQPLDFSAGPAADVVDEGLRALVDPDPLVRLEGLDLALLHRALWRCPACLDEQPWNAAELRCGCGAAWSVRADGLLEGPGGPTTFTALARPTWQVAEQGPLTTTASGWREVSARGPAEPLEPLGDAQLVVSPEGVRFGQLELAIDAISSVSTERADTLQVATSAGMWQFRPEGGSVFRLHRALEAWRGSPPTMRERGPSQRLRDHLAAAGAARLVGPPVGAAVGLGLVVTESALVVRPLMDGFGAGGVWAPLAGALLACVGVGLAVDRLFGTSDGAWARGGTTLAAFAVLAGVAGQSAVASALVLAGAAAWAALVLGRKTWPMATAIAAWAFAPALPTPAAVSTLSDGIGEGPSVLVVALDTVRRDRTSAYGYARDTTPQLRGLAERGLRFDRAYSTSNWSLPAHASLFTGLLPSQHGAHYEHLALGDAAPTLAERFVALGYATAGFSANPLVAPGTGLARGFGHFEESWRTYTLREALFAWRVWHRFAAPERDKGGRQAVRGASAWMQAQEGPWFAFVNLMEAHAPYQEVPRRWRRAYVDPELSYADLERIGERSHMAQVLGSEVPEADHGVTGDLADGAVLAVDAYLGELLAAAGEEAVVVVLSDHGELFGEHGVWGHDFGLWEPLVQVPLVLAGPGVPQGTSDRAASLIDVDSTLLGLVDAEPLGLGTDLLGQQDGERTLVAEHLRTDFLTAGWQMTDPLGDHTAIRARRAVAVRGDLKRSLAEHGEDLGFDLTRDPGEQAPFDGAETGLTVSLPEPGEGGSAAFDRASLRALEALGYVR